MQNNDSLAKIYLYSLKLNVPLKNASLLCTHNRVQWPINLDHFKSHLAINVKPKFDNLAVFTSL